MRPRNVLLAACPWLSREEASDVLRGAGGDVEKAKGSASAARRHTKKTDEDGEGSEADATASSASAACEHTSGVSQTSQNIEGNSKSKPSSPPARAPPRHSASINNLSDRQYCCVWGVEVYEDGYRPDVARTLLATVARHVNPILRDRGWRVKRLIESASNQWIGLCTANGRNDADAASTNIQLNLRLRPDKHCQQFRSFHQILAVMLHEITHTSIGLEDIHPPAFYELLDQIKVEYKDKRNAGEIDAETDDYGCNGQFIRSNGELASVATSASDVLGTGISNLSLLGTSGTEGDCGASKRRRRRKNWKRKSNLSAGYTSNVPNKEKRRPLLKGSKMIDKRTKVGKSTMAERENVSARELAARAALARFGNAVEASTTTSSKAKRNNNLSDDIKGDDSGDLSDGSSDEEDEEGGINERINKHSTGCGCRSCDWSKLFSLE